MTEKHKMKLKAKVNETANNVIRKTIQKEAIERLYSFKTIKVLYGNTFAMTLGQLKTLQEDLETLSNMLKEKDKKLKMYKDIKEIANYKVTDLAKLKKLNEMQKEIEKKDKMIDYLLRAYLYSIASGEKFTLEINDKKYKDTEIDNRIEQLRKFVENNILKE